MSSHVEAGKDDGRGEQPRTVVLEWVSEIPGGLKTWGASLQTRSLILEVQGETGQSTFLTGVQVMSTLLI